MLIPWDAALSFDTPWLSIDARRADNRLMAKLMTVPSYAELYRDELRRALASASDLAWLETEIERQLAVIGDALRDDTRQPFSPSAIEVAVEAMRAFARERIAFVGCELERGAGACR